MSCPAYNLGWYPETLNWIWVVSFCKHDIKFWFSAQSWLSLWFTPRPELLWNQGDWEKVTEYSLGFREHFFLSHQSPIMEPRANHFNVQIPKIMMIMNEILTKEWKLLSEVGMGGRERKEKYLKTTSCFYKGMGQPCAIHQLTNAGKSWLIGTRREWGEGLQHDGFSFDRKVVSAFIENLSRVSG